MGTTDEGSAAATGLDEEVDWSTYLVALDDDLKDDDVVAGFAVEDAEGHGGAEVDAEVKVDASVEVDENEVDDEDEVDDDDEEVDEEDEVDDDCGMVETTAGTGQRPVLASG